MTPPALALVESPAQLLNVLEWALGDRRGADEGPVAVAVLLPQDEPTRRQLDAVSTLARSAGLRVSAYEVRGRAAALAGCCALLAPRLAGARRLVLGDPFSRVVQLLLPLSPAAELVLVDDGTATLELSELLLAGRPLVRWHRGGTGRSPRAADRTTRRLTPRRGHRLELFTAMSGPLTLPPGTVARSNQYSWARGRFGPPTVVPLVDLAGCSLVETGLVTAARYVEGVAELARRRGVSRYLAHRRESPEKLQQLELAAGIEIVQPRLPLELAVLTEPIGATVLSFPSTVLHTLPRILREYPVEVAACEEIRGWLRHDASAHASDFLRRVTGAGAAADLSPGGPTLGGRTHSSSHRSGQEAELT